jgi:hypothetical protein
VKARRRVTFHEQIADINVQVKSSQRSRASTVTGNMRPKESSSRSSFHLSIRSRPQSMTPRSQSCEPRPKVHLSRRPARIMLLMTVLWTLEMKHCSI